MAKHYNNTLNESANRNFSFKGESIDPEVIDGIQPVVDMLTSIPCNIVRQSSTVNSASATIYTTPSDKDFYLVGYVFSIIKDATATATNMEIYAYIDGVNRSLCRIVGLTLTPQNDSIAMQFEHPIKVDRGTNISIINNTAVANLSVSANIFGYTVETTKGV